MPHTEHVESSKRRNLKLGRDDAVLSSTYSVHRSAREVNRSGADTQVVSSHGYLVFHSYVACFAVLQNQLAHTSANFPISTLTQELYDTSPVLNYNQHTKALKLYDAPPVLVHHQHTNTRAAWHTLVLIFAYNHNNYDAGHISGYHSALVTDNNLLSI